MGVARSDRQYWEMVLHTIQKIWLEDHQPLRQRGGHWSTPQGRKNCNLDFTEPNPTKPNSTNQNQPNQTSPIKTNLHFWTAFLMNRYLLSSSVRHSAQWLVLLTYKNYNIVISVSRCELLKVQKGKESFMTLSSTTRPLVPPTMKTFSPSITIPCANLAAGS